jgi:superfamily II DNA/RNA helicase
LPATPTTPTPPPTAPGSSFAELGVPSILTAALTTRGITTPRPIQARTLPDALAGRDVLGRAETGSGKTLAFGLPLLVRTATATTKRLARQPRGLVLVPTRELAEQVHNELLPLAAVLGLRLLAVYGGVPLHRQAQELRRGTDVAIATPGRLLDLLRQGTCSLDAVAIAVLDEADHMADMGFLPAVTHCWTASRPEGSGCCSRPPSTARSTPSSAATSPTRCGTSSPLPRPRPPGWTIRSAP